MRQLLLVFIVMLIGSQLLSQAKFVKLSEFKSGYIFTEDYQPNFKMGSIEGRFTPNLEEIEQAEKLLDYFDTTSRKSKKINRRQYLGFMSGDTKYILMHTLYYKCEKQFKNDYPNWNNSLAYLFSGPDEFQKSNLYVVNLNDRTIGFFENF